MMSPISFCNFAIFHFFLSCLPSFPARKPSLDVDRCPTAKQAVSGRWRLGMCKTRTASWFSAHRVCVGGHIGDRARTGHAVRSAGDRAAGRRLRRPPKARRRKRSQTRCASINRSNTGSVGAVPARRRRRDAGRARQRAEGAVLPRQVALPPALLPVGARGVRRDLGAGHGPPVLRSDACSGSRSSASQLPEPAGIIEKIGRFGVDQLEQFNTGEQADRTTSCSI